MGNAEFTKIILSQIHNLLKTFGYRKRGQLFEKENSELVYLIGLQKSIYNSQLEIKVTVNLAVWIKSLTPIRAGKPDKPNVWSAHWRQRLGCLTPSRSDKWWFVDNEFVAQKAAQEICDNLSNYGLPKFSEIQTVSDLTNLWNKGIYCGLTDFQVKNYLKKLKTAEN